MKDIAFPYNLFEELGIGRAEMPRDAEATLYYLLYSECGSKREADITLMRYRDEITLKDIADAYLLTPERVHSIILNVKEKLQEEKNRNLLLKGVREYIEEEKIKSYHIGKGEYKANIEHCKNYSQPSYNDSVESLNLPERVYSALLENQTRINGILKISTVGDIITVGSRGIAKVRGIGSKGYRKIAEVLVRDYGEDPDEWRYKRRA